MSKLGAINEKNRKPPATTVPIVRDLFSRIDSNDVSMVSLAASSGYDRVAISRMRHGGSTPLLSTFVDVAEAAGYELVLRPLSKPA